MRTPRIYCSQKLSPEKEITLNINSSSHLLNVLRLNLGAKLAAFDGGGSEYKAILIGVKNRQAVIKIEKFIDINNESSLKIILAQCMAKAEKMDYIMQKAVELGVFKIVPLSSSRSAVKLTAEREQKKQQRWQTIAINACEQSGRTVIPQITAPKPLADFLTELHSGNKLILEPTAQLTLSAAENDTENLVILIGPEGGFSPEELASATKRGFNPVKLGPRILRTETAALATISALQTKWGDFK